MNNSEFLIGSHVSMKAPNMLLGSAKEALSYNDKVFMVYTGAPQNTKRKPIEDLKVNEAHEFMEKNNLGEIVIHAPYIINLGNTEKPENFKFAVEFLKQEIKRSEAFGAKQIVLHPGSHVGAGVDAGINQIIKGLNEVIDPNQNVQIALETMAGKGSELGTTFEQLKRIIDGVKYNEKLSVTFDTCHTNDAGYDVKNNFDNVLDEFDRIIGLDKLKVVHLNDSKNEKGSHKDRHEVIGFGTIGFDSLNYIAHHSKLANVPKIMETPAIVIDEDKKKKASPHLYEVEMLKKQVFNDNLIDDVKRDSTI
ncbi:deoxyribonuclease IV [Lactobacillus sp. S2-2]|uniref:deoxyribonuclease IV n=1 Tax=Lactobacillus sp. S2-2 TaxID=2692917 RepID=UPI001F010A5F|nr:deoxyribonuclease IV [Lactobacillus sp. S2-2]MCF6514979.1 deoxyribonuclease IV [Lactobacillus sp. S2-2]